jgi:hypothetical protein
MMDIEVRVGELRIAITWPSRSQPDTKDAPAQSKPLLSHTSAVSLVRHESEVISRLRRQLAEKFKRPVDHRFFSDRYLPGEESSAALLRMFKQLQWAVSLTDEQTIESMVRGG